MMTLEAKLKKNRVAVVSTDMRFIGTVNWSRAVTLVVLNTAKVVLERTDGAMVRSPSINMRWPLVISVDRGVDRPHSFEMDPDDHASKRMIRIRDDWTCQYCHKYGDTVDHIFPKSRGGGNTWGNLCVACRKCNEEKEDRTPEEAGLETPVIGSMFSATRINNIEQLISQAIRERGTISV